MRTTLLLSLACLLSPLVQPAFVQAQVVPSVGSPDALDVATWNVEWFGSPANGPVEDEKQFRNVLSVIRAADVDLWALQEVADPADFDRLLDSLGPGYGGALATNSGTQRIGFLYDRSVVQPTRLPQHILTEHEASFGGRPPLEMRATVNLPDTSVTMIFVVVHMKAFGDLESYEDRVRASSSLKGRLDFLQPNAPVVVLGDFNDELRASTHRGSPSPYQNFVADAEDYRFLTLPLDEANEATFCSEADCSAGSTLDHILVTDELFAASTAARRYTEVLEVPGYVFTTSDHLPVLARFDFAAATGTSAEEDPGPARLTLTPLSNPTRGDLQLRLTAACPDPATIAVYDMVGRRAASVAIPRIDAGANLVRIPASTWPAGVYLARASACGETAVRLVHLLR